MTNTHSETGRSVTLSGKGPVGKRVNIYSVERGGPLAGDAVATGGTWRMATTPIPLGTTAHFFARSIKQDGTDESADSEPVTVEIPPA